jgi:hypothetical protein
MNGPLSCSWPTLDTNRTRRTRYSRGKYGDYAGADTEIAAGTFDAGKNAMMIVALIILGFAVAGVVLGLFAVTAAPVGYQDEKGFHFGPDKVERTEETFALEISHAKAVA